MQALKDFIKTTIVGGLVFLVPLVLVLLVLRHAMSLTVSFTGPIAAAFAGHKIVGVTIATLLAALTLLVVSFVAGLFARTEVGRNLARWLEDSLLGNLPQYRMMTTMAEGLAQIEDSASLRPVLVSVEGGWQLGYWVEDLRPGWVVVFVPQAPTPMAGNIMYMPQERVRPLDMPIGEALILVKRLGVGSAKFLRSTELPTLPPG
jgi:uncharacterized membrane protein